MSKTPADRAASSAEMTSHASIPVAGTDIRLSRLGFGCVRLTFGQEESAAIRTLERAFDCGITHFDVARLYGMGTAEKILGTFAKPRRSRITISTKVGLLPPASLAKRPGLVRLAKKVLGPFPKLLKWAKRAAAGGERAIEFDSKVIAASFETSLQALRTDYVDVLLLHEATLADSRSDETLSFIEHQLKRGSIRCAGVGSSAGRFRPGGPLPAVYRIAQFDHNAVSPSLDVLEAHKDRLCIVHSVFAPLKRLLAFAGTAPPNSASRNRISEQLGVDLRDESAVRSLLLHHALRTNPTGGVLFSSTSGDHIAANARDAASGRFTDGQIDLFARYAATVTGNPDTANTEVGK
jgi:aryl-alcohol dehydrogenase-like predicted oxidoreductase